jgi:ATP-dependent RNA helicase RhlE
MGFTSPRPIQDQGLPPALEGRDVLGLAQTGTGKTAAFVLPILQRLLDRPGPGPRALIVAPTRELASQVQAEFAQLALHTPITSTVVFGGVPIPRQVRALRQHPDVVVACPGRLLDLLGQGALRLDKVEVLVLDEADHMFDMGFLPDVRRILKALPARRQNLLFSATMPPEIRKLADTILRKPAVIELGNSRPAETIAHALYPLVEGDKIGAVERLLGAADFRSAIVFLRTKRRAKQLAQRLEERGRAAIALQGNMSQPQRERALKGFREGRYDVLVATDIAARGLDIAGVSHVINFDVPNTPDAYTHRIGRTGRSEQTGTAFTFVTPDDGEAVRAIEKRLGAKIERRPLSELGPLESGTLKGARGGRQQAQSRPRSSRAGGPRPAPARQARPTRVKPPTRLAEPVVAAPPAHRPAFGLGVQQDASPRRSGSSRDVKAAPAAGRPAFGQGVTEPSAQASGSDPARTGDATRSGRRRQRRA